MPDDRSLNITVHDATAARWPDFEKLMGPKGGSGGCWCMLWRLSSKAYKQTDGVVRRQAMQEIFSEPVPPGVLAYDGERPIG